MTDLLLDPYPEADAFIVVVDGKPLLDGKGSFTIIPPDEAIRASLGATSPRLRSIAWAMHDPNSLQDITPA